MPSKHMEAAIEAVRQREQTGHVEWRQRAGVTDAVRDLTRHYEALARNAKMAADGLPSKAKAFAGDDMVPSKPAGVCGPRPALPPMRK